MLLSNCKPEKDSKPVYLDDIGDTVFNPELDAVNFTFCDSTDVLHKRARISYVGGTPNMEKELLAAYVKKSEYESFSGYFFIRFAVNCKNESGRFRWEIVDEEFKETKCPKALEEEIIRAVKSLQYWNHPIYEGESHDGYTYLIVKIKNGTILRS